MHSTPPKQVIEHKGKIKDVATQIDDCEKVAKPLADETTQFWMSHHHKDQGTS